MRSKPSLARIRSSVRSIPDFPKKGILFRDITPLLADAALFGAVVDRFKAWSRGRVDAVVSIESRGFILGAALAYALGAGFVPVRKAGKLPHRTHRSSYELEYGTATVEIHVDALRPGARVIVLDDVLATGGTARAAVELVQKFEGRIAGVFFLIELDALRGRKKLAGYPVRSLLHYP